MQSTQTMQISNFDISIPGSKLSYYNFFLTYDTGESVIFNSLYRSLLAFDVDETTNLRNGHIPDSLKDDLIANHILIPEELDEWKSYEEAYLNANNHSEVLSICVMPTLSCCLACPYCFERKRATKMSVQTEDDIINWIVQQLPNYKVLSTSWFGGEPLMYQDTIRRLSESLMAKCDELGIIYTSAITTNGVLLDNPETIDMLKQCAIHNVQITFDGNQQAHDAQKFIRGGQGTYELLLRNAALYCSSNPAAKLRIRVNVSDDNYHTIGQLLEDLAPLKEKIVIFFRWVYANSASHWHNYSEKEKGTNPYQGIYELQKAAINRGFVVDDQYDKHQFRFAHCEADSQGFYSIDPLGNLYTCVHEYDPKYAVGNVRDGILPEKEEEYNTFRMVNASTDPECKTCKVFPMCNGGCRRYRINKGKHFCIDEKQSMELYIDMLYRKFTDYH